MKLIKGIEFFSVRLDKEFIYKFKFDKKFIYRDIFDDLCTELDINSYVIWDSDRREVTLSDILNHYNPKISKLRKEKDNEADFIGKVFNNLFLDRIKELNEECEFDMVLDNPFEVYVYMEICNSVICNEELEGELRVKLKSVTPEPESGEGLFKAVISLKGSKYFISRINRQWEGLNVEYLKEHVMNEIDERL